MLCPSWPMVSRTWPSASIADASAQRLGTMGRRAGILPLVPPSQNQSAAPDARSLDARCSAGAGLAAGAKAANVVRINHVLWAPGGHVLTPFLGCAAFSLLALCWPPGRTHQARLGIMLRFPHVPGANFGEAVSPTPKKCLWRFRPSRAFLGYTWMAPTTGDFEKSFSDTLADETKSREHLENDAQTQRTRPEHLSWTLRSTTPTVAGEKGNFSRRVGFTTRSFLSSDLSLGSGRSRSPIRGFAYSCLCIRPQVSPIYIGRKINWTKNVQEPLDEKRPDAIILVAVELPATPSTHGPRRVMPSLVAHGPAGVSFFHTRSAR